MEARFLVSSVVVLVARLVIDEVVAGMVCINAGGGGLVRVSILGLPAVEAGFGSWV